MNKTSNIISVNTPQLNQLLTVQAKHIIYIGRPTCPGCIEMEPILSEISDKENLKIYYYNTKKAREEELEEFYKVRTDFDAHYIPLLLYYDGNKEIDRLDYYRFIESEHSVAEFIKKATQD